MKDERKKIIELANEIARLEKECQLKNNISKNMKKLEQLTSNLSLQEMLEIDNYILEQKLLTK